MGFFWFAALKKLFNFSSFFVIRLLNANLVRIFIGAAGFAANNSAQWVESRESQEKSEKVSLKKF
jgi:hypothetical protein